MQVTLYSIRHRYVTYIGVCDGHFAFHTHLNGLTCDRLGDVSLKVIIKR